MENPSLDNGTQKLLPSSSNEEELELVFEDLQRKETEYEEYKIAIVKTDYVPCREKDLNLKLGDKVIAFQV